MAPAAAVLLCDKVIYPRDVRVDRLAVRAHGFFHPIGGDGRVIRGHLRFGGRRLGAIGRGVGARRRQLRLLDRFV
ncbi:MAG TPA: hypothetical protein VGH29_02160 [Candidatus Binataceae bacterium]